MSVITSPKGGWAFASARWAALAWALLHIVAGTLIVTTSIQEGPSAGLADLGSAAPVGSLPSQPGPVVDALLRFHGLNIVWFGLAVLLLGYRGTARSLTAALLVMAAADIGLLAFLLGPGHMKWSDGLWGPLLLLASGAALLVAWRRAAREPLPQGVQ